MIVGIWRFSLMDYSSWVFLFSVSHFFPEIWMLPTPSVHHGCDAHVQTGSVITGLPSRVSLQARHRDKGNCCIWALLLGQVVSISPFRSFWMKQKRQQVMFSRLPLLRLLTWPLQYFPFWIKLRQLLELLETATCCFSCLFTFFNTHRCENCLKMVGFFFF